MRRILVVPFLGLAMLAMLDRAIAAGSPLTIVSQNFDALPLGPLSSPNVIRSLPGDQVDVVGPTLGFTSEALLLDSVPGGLASVGFFNPTQFFSGDYLIQWRSAVSANPADGTNVVSGATAIGVSLVALNTSAPSILSVGYDPSGSFRISHTTSPSFLVGAYTAGVPDLFQVLLDMDSHTYSLNVNGATLASGMLDPTLGFNHTVFDSINRFTASDLPLWVIDDVSVTQDPVPEPATLTLLGSGIVAGTIRRYRRRT